ncbi:MAG: adenylate/guanylate cyclase domain-containing protein [Elusimicrobia bacterium]|nr:adenylate/guanylate cyclase domain-containing protein [Elusimicrobiota bacterium]
MRRKTIAYLLGAVAVFIILILNFLGTLDLLEWKSYDFRLQLRGQKEPTGEIVIAAIDEPSLARYGRWPWDRSIHARMVDRLTDFDVKTIGFDVFFSEKSNPRSDRLLEEAIARSRRSVSEVYFEVENMVATKAHPPSDAIIKGSAGLGYPYVAPEMDGIIRKIMPVMRYKDELYPHISIAVAAAYLGKPWKEVVKEIPLDNYGEMLVNHCGGFETYKYISYCDILDAKIDKEELKNKIVLLGFAASGLYDRHATPFSPTLPGIETVANNINACLNADYISYPSAWTGFLSIVIIGCILTVLLPKLSPWKSTALTLVVFALWSGICVYYFIGKQIWIQYIPSTFLIFLSYISITSWRFITEEKEKRWLKKAFGQYLSPVVITEIMKNPDSLALGGKRQELSVLFSDIRGFTTISEASTPEEIVALLNEYLTKMTEIVFKYEGTLDKFIGDAVMAFWNAPIAQEDHAQRAVFCAIEMIEELAILQDKWRAENKPIIDIGIGVNTGEMVVGNMGSVDKMDYTVIGDNVNLGARLESLNKEYKTHIIISESTYKLVKDKVKVKDLGTTKVKGKAKPVEIYEVKGRK